MQAFPCSTNIKEPYQSSLANVYSSPSESLTCYILSRQEVTREVVRYSPTKDLYEDIVAHFASEGGSLSSSFNRDLRDAVRFLGFPKGRARRTI